MSQATKQRWGMMIAGLALVAYVVAFGIFFDDAAVDLGWGAVSILGLAAGIQLLAVWLFGELFRQGVAATGKSISSGLGFRAALVGSSVARLLPAGGAVTPVAMAWTVRRQASGTGGAALRATALNYGGLILITGFSLFVYSLNGARAELAGPLRIFAGIAVLVGVVVIGVASRLGALRERLPDWFRNRFGPGMVDQPIDLRSHGYMWSRLGAEMVVLGLVLAVFGLDLGVVEVATAFGISQIAAGIPGTPGGLGFAEAGLLGALSFFGVGAAAAMAPVLVFRVVSYWLPAGAGLVAGTSSFLKAVPES